MQRITSTATVFVFGSILLFPAQAQAETATAREMEVVCRNWISYIVNQQGDWAGEAKPKIVGVDEISVDGRVLARCFSTAPQGYVVVPILKQLPPVKAYSDECTLNASVNGGLPQLLRDVLSRRIPATARRSVLTQ